MYSSVTLQREIQSLFYFSIQWEDVSGFLIGRCHLVNCMLIIITALQVLIISYKTRIIFVVVVVLRSSLLGILLTRLGLKAFVKDIICLAGFSLRFQLSPAFMIYELVCIFLLHCSGCCRHRDRGPQVKLHRVGFGPVQRLVMSFWRFHSVNHNSLATEYARMQAAPPTQTHAGSVPSTGAGPLSWVLPIVDSTGTSSTGAGPLSWVLPIVDSS